MFLLYIFKRKKENEDFYSLFNNVLNGGNLVVQ
jgi:hypothetical protein